AQRRPVPAPGVDGQLQRGVWPGGCAPLGQPGQCRGGQTAAGQQPQRDDPGGCLAGRRRTLCVLIRETSMSDYLGAVLRGLESGSRIGLGAYELEQRIAREKRLDDRQAQRDAIADQQWTQTYDLN